MTAPKTVAQQYVEAVERGNIALRVRLEQQLDDETTEANARLTAPDALLKAALWYARRGVAVFPCEYRGKKPLTENGLHDATADEAKILAWWTRRPGANIGAPTGITFDVIDVDGPEAVGVIYGKFDNPDRPTLPAEIGHTLTSRDAGHHIFIAPTGRGNGANIYPHVDFRGVGGYVILPPSIGANGRRYQWTCPLPPGAAA